MLLNALQLRRQLLLTPLLLALVPSHLLHSSSAPLMLDSSSPNRRWRLKSFSVSHSSMVASSSLLQAYRHSGQVTPLPLPHSAPTEVSGWPSAFLFCLSSQAELKALLISLEQTLQQESG